MSDSEPALRAAPVLRRRPLLIALGIGLVAVFLVLELLLLRSYQDTARTTRNFQGTTDATTAIASLQRETLLLQRRVSRLPKLGGSEAALAGVELQRGLLGRHLLVVEASASARTPLVARMAMIRATLERFDAAFGGKRNTKRVAHELETLDLEVKQVFDEEEHALYAALSQTLHERAKGQRMVIGLSLFVLLFGISLAVAIRRAIRGDFARAYAALATEASQRELLQEQLWHQATHDPLTNLGNRVKFQRDLGEIARDHGGLFAVLYVDLDGFKGVNDTLGHDAGDILLREIAQRLTASVRGGDRIARLGGDEFAVFIDGVTDSRDALDTAERLRQAVSEPLLLRGRTVSVDASVGVALCDGDNHDADELIASADLAMYAAKHAGKGGVRLYDTAMRKDALKRAELETELRSAIENDELELHYQPIVDLSSKGLLGLEALIRWRHPSRGLLAPIEFLPVAEECELIIPIGNWVLEKACRDAVHWPLTTAGRDAPWVSVNVAPAQIEDPSLVDDVTRVLDESGLDPSRLMLEISERTALTAGPHPGAVLNELQELGLRIALDDFGTGYTALSTLRFLAVNVLKLDKSFIDDIATDPDRQRIAAAILELADTLGLETVAEGIEGPEQLAALRELECGMGQGFHFSRPIPPEALDNYLELAAQPAPPVAAGSTQIA
jgi:diguanylate cyclase (GGDEF)-like protein